MEIDEIDIALDLINNPSKNEKQLEFNFKNSKPMSGAEYKQKIASATARYLKRKELVYADTRDDEKKSSEAW